MRIFITVMLILTPCFALQKGGFGGFSIGLLLPEVDDLNDQFRTHQIPEFSGKSIGLGGGGFAIIDKVMIGGRGYSAQEIVESDSIRAELVASAGEFRVGYNLISARYFNGLVSLGFGSIAYRLGLRPLLADVSFDDLLTDPGRYVDLETSHFLINPGAMVIFSVPYKPISFFHIGISGSANINLFGQDWQYDGKKVLNTPDTGAITPVFSIYFLFGVGI